MAQSTDNRTHVKQWMVERLRFEPCFRAHGVTLPASTGRKSRSGAGRWKL